MTVETVTYITDLDKTLPAASDGLSEADDHFRNIKKALENSFSGFTGAAMTSTEAELNDVPAIRSDLTTAEADIITLQDDVKKTISVFFDGAGAVTSGSTGVSVTKDATGTYTITLPSPFSADQKWGYSAVAKVQTSGSSERLVVAENSRSDGSVQIYVTGSGGGKVDRAVSMVFHYHG